MIFNLFKSRPALKELIPKGFVDIHSHILPGVDDGAKNVEESLIIIIENQNFYHVIRNKHKVRVSGELVDNLCNDLQSHI